MKRGVHTCEECGQDIGAFPPGKVTTGDHCAACGAPLDAKARSDFASRLARFGLGDTPHSLLGRVPELPDAK